MVILSEPGSVWNAEGLKQAGSLEAVAWGGQIPAWSACVRDTGAILRTCPV